MAASVAVALAVPAPRPTSPLRQVVAYLVSAWADSAAVEEDEALAGSPSTSHPWQWRVFDPQTGRDALFLALTSFPRRIWWDPEFRSVEYEVAGRRERAPWRLGARPKPLARSAVDAPKEGAQGVNPTHVAASALLDSMGIGHHVVSELSRDPARGPEDYAVLVWEPLTPDSSIGLELTVEIGDNEHAMAPLVWVDRRQARRKTIRSWDQESFNQLAYAWRGSFLLVVDEDSGSFPVVADTRTGDVVFRVSRPSARAVWVPAPR